MIQANKNEKRLTEFGGVMMLLEAKNLGTEPELPFLDLYCFSKDYKNDSHEYKIYSHDTLRKKQNRQNGLEPRVKERAFNKLKDS